MESCATAQQWNSLGIETDFPDSRILLVFGFSPLGLSDHTAHPTILVFSQLLGTDARYYFDAHLRPHEGVCTQ
jgi:hypothetical protein